MSAAQCVVWDDQRALTAGVARRIVDLVSDIQRNGGVGGAQGADGFARIVLTGGGAGIGVLTELAALDHAARETADSFPVAAVDWSRVHVFFATNNFL